MAYEYDRIESEVGPSTDTDKTREILFGEAYAGMVGLAKDDRLRQQNSNTADDLILTNPYACSKGEPSLNLNSEDVQRLAETNFSRIDTDADGHLSESEVDAAMLNHDFRGEDARFINVLKQHQDELEELNDDEIGDENDGITIHDFEAFDRSVRTEQAEVEPLRRAVNSTRTRFNDVDVDRDRYLSAAELDGAIQSQSFTAEQRNGFRLLRNRLGDLEEASNDEWGDENDGITRQDLSEYADSTLNSADSNLVQAVDRTLDRAETQVNGTSRELFANGDSPLESIRPEAIDQGRCGDCYFLAALSSVAATNPEAIRNMIVDNGDGTYTVTFPGAPDEPITVAAPTEQELGRFQAGSEHGIWPAVLEKAYGEYCNRNFWRRDIDNILSGDLPQEGADGGSSLNDGLRILTGRDVDVEYNEFASEADLHRTLINAFEDGRPVTASRGGRLVDQSQFGLPSGHAYAVTGYDPQTQMLTIYNPWGHGEPLDQHGRARDGVDDGMFTMTLDEFRREFSRLNCAE